MRVTTRTHLTHAATVLALLTAAPTLASCGSGDPAAGRAAAPRSATGSSGAGDDGAFQDGGTSGTSDPVTVVRDTLAAIKAGNWAAACASFEPDYAAEEFIVQAAEDDVPDPTCATALQHEVEGSPTDWWRRDVVTATITDDYGTEKWVTVVRDPDEASFVWTLHQAADGTWYINKQFDQ